MADWSTIVVAVLAIAASLGGAGGMLVATARKATRDWLSKDNADLRAALEYRDHEHDREMASCHEMIAKLQAENEVLKGPLIEEIVRRILRTLRDSRLDSDT